MTRHYFTFGYEQTLPDGRPAKDEYVIVVTTDPATDARAIFMAWLGSNAFASEYVGAEWDQPSRYYAGKNPAAIISVASA